MDRLPHTNVVEGLACLTPASSCGRKGHQKATPADDKCRCPVTTVGDTWGPSADGSVSWPGRQPSGERWRRLWQLAGTSICPELPILLLLYFSKGRSASETTCQTFSFSETMSLLLCTRFVSYSGANTTPAYLLLYTSVLSLFPQGTEMAGEMKETLHVSLMLY